MAVVIDIQSLKDKFNHFTPKEVAVTAVHSTYFGHWIVKSTHAHDDLPPAIKRQNRWLQSNHHGISWTEGDTTVQAIELILKKIATEADRIFTRGSDKASYLTRLTGCFIINLEEDDEVPSFRNLPTGNTRCIYHGLLRKNHIYKCALDNVTKIKAWLCHSDRFDSLWEYRTTTNWRAGLSECAVEEKNPSVATTARWYEQPSNSALSPEHKGSHSRRIPCRSNPEGVDETDSHRC